MSNVCIILSCKCTVAVKSHILFQIRRLLRLGAKTRSISMCSNLNACNAAVSIYTYHFGKQSAEGLGFNGNNHTCVIVGDITFCNENLVGFEDNQIAVISCK